MSGYNHPAMALAQAKAPELTLAPERLPDDAPADPPEAVRQAKALGANILQHQYMVLTKEVMDALHAADVAVWSWTTNTEQSMVDGINLHADALMGDDMRLMIEVIDRFFPRKTKP
jgi:glycerophosphoryl diester phosphodiesterase